MIEITKATETDLINRGRWKQNEIKDWIKKQYIICDSKKWNGFKIEITF